MHVEILDLKTSPYTRLRNSAGKPSSEEKSRKSSCRPVETCSVSCACPANDDLGNCEASCIFAALRKVLSSAECAGAALAVVLVLGDIPVNSKYGLGFRRVGRRRCLSPKPRTHKQLLREANRLNGTQARQQLECGSGSQRRSFT